MYVSAFKALGYLPITVQFPNQEVGMSALDWNQIPHVLCARHQFSAGRVKPPMALPVCPFGYSPSWQCSFIPQSYPKSSLKGNPSLKQLWNSQRTFHRTEVLKLIIEWMEEGSKNKKLYHHARNGKEYFMSIFNRLVKRKQNGILLFYLFLFKLSFALA